MISAPYGEYLKGVTGDGNGRLKCQWTHIRSPKASRRASSRFVQMQPCGFVAMAMARERIGDLNTRKEIFLLIPTVACVLFLDLQAACGSFIWFHSQRSLSLTEVMNGSV